MGRIYVPPQTEWVEFFPGDFSIVENRRGVWAGYSPGRTTPPVFFPADGIWTPGARDVAATNARNGHVRGSAGLPIGGTEPGLGVGTANSNFSDVLGSVGDYLLARGDGGGSGYPAESEYRYGAITSLVAGRFLGGGPNTAGLWLDGSAAYYMSFAPPGAVVIGWEPNTSNAQLPSPAAPQNEIGPMTVTLTASPASATLGDNSGIDLGTGTVELRGLLESNRVSSPSAVDEWSVDTWRWQTPERADQPLIATCTSVTDTITTSTTTLDPLPLLSPYNLDNEVEVTYPQLIASYLRLVEGEMVGSGFGLWSSVRGVAVQVMMRYRSLGGWLLTEGDPPLRQYQRDDGLAHSVKRQFIRNRATSMQEKIRQHKAYL